MINPLSKQWFTSNAFSHYSCSLKFIVLGGYCKIFSAMFLWALALLLSVCVEMKPNLVLCHSVLWRPLKKLLRLNCRARLSWRSVIGIREATRLVSSLLECGVSAQAVPWFAPWVTLEGLEHIGKAAQACRGEEEAKANAAIINSSTKDVVEKILLYCSTESHFHLNFLVFKLQKHSPIQSNALWRCTFQKHQLRCDISRKCWGIWESE